MNLYSVTGNIWVISKDEFLWDWKETEETINIDLFYINVSGEGNGSLLQYEKSFHKQKKKVGGILLSPQKEWNDAIWDNMEGPRDHHTQWSKSDRIRHISCDNTYVES